MVEASEPNGSLHAPSQMNTSNYVNCPCQPCHNKGFFFFDK